MKFLTVITILSLFSFNQDLEDSTRPNYLKLNKELIFVSDSLKTDSIKVKLIKQEQIQINYKLALDTLYFQGAYSPISKSNLDSIDYGNWDYVSDRFVAIFTDSSLSLINRNLDSSTNFKKSW